MNESIRVAIIGGGVAGLAAATALSRASLDVRLFEARRSLGGRAGAFFDASTGEWLDHCQHVAMGCCTHYLHFCREMDIAHLFRRERTLHFFGPEGQRVDLRAARWLPPPLHLAPFLWRLDYLSWSERRRAAITLLRLARLSAAQAAGGPTIGQWLEEQRQSRRARERFWAPVLVSALSETLDRASLSAARQVFVDGFLAHRRAYEVIVPTVPLGELYDHRVAAGLVRRGVVIERACRVERVEMAADGKWQLHMPPGRRQCYEAIVIAVPWRPIRKLLSPAVSAAIPQLDDATAMQAAPITSLHLWFDRPIMDLSHAVLIDRLAQWIFRRDPPVRPADGDGLHYYQVVISASRNLQRRDRQDTLATVLDELRQLWPDVAAASLVKWRLLTQQEAVFSIVPGIDQRRPGQATPLRGLWLAGDWTATGWPATMEGAVRSGYQAANGLLAEFGRPTNPPVANLPPGWLYSWLARHRS